MGVNEVERIGSVTFRRRTLPLADGRVKVKVEIEVDGQGKVGEIVGGRLGWVFRPAARSAAKGSAKRARAAGQGSASPGHLWPTAEAARRAVACEWERGGE